MFLVGVEKLEMGVCWSESFDIVFERKVIFLRRVKRGVLLVLGVLGNVGCLRRRGDLVRRLVLALLVCYCFVIYLDYLYG